ncbi:Fe-S cluster assembly protein SufD [Arsenophonus symbiont of Ornithomya chloropus]|uniref:Fe-S cluster assembly protein SufD n=1 Tax=Arsenophonus symbiont of Ornithomya chloropus TaxID=634121 RepID=UPI0032B20EA3
MLDLLIKCKKKEEKIQMEMLNQQALKHFSDIFYSSKRANEQEAINYWNLVEKIGFPLFKDEAWHYTPLKELLTAKYQLTNNTFHNIHFKSFKDIGITNLDGWRIVLIDGYFIPNLSSDDFFPYQIHNLQDVMKKFPVPILNNDIFLYLTESLSIQPLLIKLDSNQLVEKPLYILNITSGSNSSHHINTSHYRYHLEIGVNSKAQVIEHFVSLNHQPHLTGSRFTANISDNGFLNHIKLNFENKQSFHFSHDDFVARKTSNIRSIGIFIGSKLSRHHTSSNLKGKGSTLFLNSLFLPKNKQIIDIKTYLEHNEPFSQSYQLHKSIALNNSKAIFDGVIKVSKKAVNTSAQMKNNNLLLGKEAEVNTKPQLEIYADDVQCTHAATVGGIDIEQLFYLRSRGIHVQDAQHIIMVAFTDEVSKNIHNDIIKKKVKNLVRQSFI